MLKQLPKHPTPVCYSVHQLGLRLIPRPIEILRSGYLGPLQRVITCNFICFSFRIRHSTSRLCFFNRDADMYFQMS